MKLTLLEGQGHYDVILFFLHNSLLFFNDLQLLNYWVDFYRIFFVIRHLRSFFMCVFEDNYNNKKVCKKIEFLCIEY